MLKKESEHTEQFPQQPNLCQLWLKSIGQGFGTLSTSSRHVQAVKQTEK
jgi:hypothetical protein